jgi:hypothetical protein
LASAPKGTRRSSSGGATAMGAGAAPPPPRDESRGGRKAEAKEVVVADGWGPHGSEARRCGGGRRASVG